MSSTHLTVRIDWTAGGTHDTHAEGKMPALKAWLESSPVIANADVLPTSESVFVLAREDVEAQVGRTVTDDELHDVRKTLEFALGDVISDAVFQALGGPGDGTESEPPDDEDGDEIRADGIQVGDWVREDGMDWVYVKSFSWHGDQILVWGADGSQGSFDQDTTVYVVRR